MINIFKKLLDFIYERKCYFCSKTEENSFFCSKCYGSIDYMQKKPVFTIEDCNVYAVSYYKDVIQKLIRAVKYHGKKDLAIYQAKLMYEYWVSLNKSCKKYTVIPVPMFSSKARKRKYNHMDLVAKEFCEFAKYEFDCHSLIRNRETAPQYKLSKKEREINLKNAFSLLDNKLQSPILLVDDISTTGTTLREIIKLLKNNGCSDIVALVTAIPENPSNYIY